MTEDAAMAATRGLANRLGAPKGLAGETRLVLNMLQVTFDTGGLPVDVPSEPITRAFTGALRVLHTRGWAIAQRANIHPSIAPWHWTGTKGGIAMCAEAWGRRVQFEVGMRDREGFTHIRSRLEATPAPLRRQAVIELAHLTRAFVSMGLAPPFPGPITPFTVWKAMREPTHRSALERFDDAWTAERFARGADGWPNAKELSCWSQLDADGVPLTQGARRHAYVDGRLVHGRVYGGINGMWMLYTEPGLFEPGVTLLENHNARHYFSCDPTTLPRRDQRGQAKRLEDLLGKAVAAKDFRRVAELGRVLHRITTA